MICKKHGELKTEDIYIDRYRRCRLCRRMRWTLWRIRHPEAAKKNRESWAKKNPLRIREINNRASLKYYYRNKLKESVNENDAGFSG